MPGRDRARTADPTHARDLVDELASIPWDVELSRPWLVLRAPAPLVAQGWKLHVSAHVRSFADVVRTVLPILAGAATPAKVIAGEDDLRLLNDGQFGYSQIGKVITVYPADEAEAVALAAALDRATAGFGGPAVPFDRRLHPTSLVHYRYGSFERRQRFSPLGGYLPVIRRSSSDADDALASGGALGGEEVIDDRTNPVPEWTTDPFLTAGVAVDPPRPVVLLGGRHALLGTATRTARGSIHPAIDLQTMRPVVAKRAVAWGTIDDNGRDARDRLRHEAMVLERLAGTGVSVPAVIEVVIDGDDLVLVLEELPGEPLQRWVERTTLGGGPPGPGEARAIGEQLARRVHEAHEHGVILRDLSPGNVLIETDQDEVVVGVHIVDLELAHVVGDGAPAFDRGTVGFASPDHHAGHAAPVVADDVFGLGALLWLVMTGRHPAGEPGIRSLTADRLRSVAPEADDELVAVTVSCLARRPADRPDTAASVRRRLECRVTSSHPPPVGPVSRIRREHIDHIEKGLAGARARLLHDLSAATATATATATSSAASTAGALVPPLDLANGLAGLVLAAATVAELLDDDACARAAFDGAGTLESVTPDDWDVPGLFVGLGGVAAVLCHPVVVNDARRSTAAKLAARLPELEVPSADVLNGTAGVIRALLVVGSSTDDPAMTTEAERAATGLIETALARPPDQRFRLGNGAPSEVGRACLGYGHGSAGVVDVLLDLADRTGGAWWRDAAHELAAPLVTETRRGRGGRVAWPNAVGAGPAAPVWCRGAGGLANVLDRLGHHSLAGEARASVAAARWTPPGRCHGMAGQVEILLDAGRPSDAERLARVVAGTVLPGEGDDVGSWDRWLDRDLLDGSAGVAVALARCLRPDVRPWSTTLFGPPPPQRS